MIARARERVARFGERAKVILTDGALEINAPAGSVDRFVSTYVLDLLLPGEIRSLLKEAHRVLAQYGRLGVVSLTRGRTPLTSGYLGLDATACHQPGAGRRLPPDRAA